MMPNSVKVPEWATNILAVNALWLASWSLLAAADANARTKALESYRESSEKQQDRLIDTIDHLNDEPVKLRVIAASNQP